MEKIKQKVRQFIHDIFAIFFVNPLPLGRRLSILIGYAWFTILYIVIKLHLRRSLRARWNGYVITFAENGYGNLYDQFREIFIGSAYFFSTKKERPIILDCGSNIGLSVLYFKMLYPRSIITAIEPDPTNFELLRANIKNNNLADVRLVNACLADQNENVKLYANSGDAWRVDLTLVRQIADERPGETKVIKVAAKTLDAYLNDDVDFIKMDIEGAEGKVLKQAEAKLFRAKEWVIEYHEHHANHENDIVVIENMFRRQKFTMTVPSIKNLRSGLYRFTRKN